jgi:hypothetical protein
MREKNLGEIKMNGEGESKDEDEWRRKGAKISGR